MLYREPKLELLKLKKEDVIRTSYHEWNPDEDYSDASDDNKWD